MNESNEIGKAAVHTGQVAQRYLHRNWQVVPIPARSKNPGYVGWESTRITYDQVAKRFKPDSNIGLVLGEPSGGLVDVDLDCAEAVALATTFLPSTVCISGRPSRPRSHYWYIAEIAKTSRYKDSDGAMLVELRTTGSQTVVYPSVHDVDDVRYEWHEEGDPAKVASSSIVSHSTRSSPEAYRRRAQGVG